MSVSKEEINIIIRWAARALASFLVALLLVLFVGHAFSEEGLPNLLKQPPAIQLEFAGILAIWAGMIVGWKRERAAGLLIISGMAIFHIVEGKLWLNWTFGLFDLAGILFLLSGWLWRKGKTKRWN